jgi:hypothetical protein
MMAEKYKDDWLNLATKWLSESNNRFVSAIPEIEKMTEHLQNQHRMVGCGVLLTL